MTNINQEIADLKAKLEELEAQAEAEKNGPKWILHSSGRVYETRYSAVPNYSGEIEQGNAFNTEEEALREHDKRALLQELKVFRNGYRFTRGIDNWAIYFEHATSQWGLDNYSRCDVLPLTGHFSSREEAERAIAHFGDRLNLLREG